MNELLLIESFPFDFNGFFFRLQVCCARRTQLRSAPTFKVNIYFYNEYLKREHDMRNTLRTTRISNCN